jgi:hypothetical protein
MASNDLRFGGSLSRSFNRCPVTSSFRFAHRSSLERSGQPFQLRGCFAKRSNPCPGMTALPFSACLKSAFPICHRIISH